MQVSGSSTSDLALPPGYYRGELGEWRTLPWPTDDDEKLYLIEHSLGPGLIDWAEWRTDEPGLLNDEGEQWRFTPGQARFLILWYAYDEKGRFLYRRGVKRGAKGPITHDTPVMTPDGWTTHGELRVGSRVYAQDGSITTVTALRPEVLEPTYRVHFSDDSYVDCTGSHRWPVRVRAEDGSWEHTVQTVDDMLQSGIYHEQEPRFATLPSPAVEGEAVAFQVNLYKLGYWLGSAEWDDPGDWFDNDGGHEPLEWLREQGVLEVKHIPQRWLRAPVQQRRAILHGFVDAAKMFTLNDDLLIALPTPRLGKDVEELAISLGLTPTLAGGFHAYEMMRLNYDPFEPHAEPADPERTITRIEALEPRPARCLTVEHESHVYLVGERNIPTCNTGKDPFGAAVCNMELLGPSQLWFDGDQWSGKRHDFPLVQIASNSEAQSKAVLRVANSQLGRDAVEYYRLDKGMTATYVKGTGARLEVLTASERSSEGNPATFVMLNETHHFTEASGGHYVAQVARRNVGKSKASLQARALEFTNAHLQGSDSIGEKSFLAWQKQQSGKYPGLNKDILYDSIEADPRLDLYDESERDLAIRQAYADAPWADIVRLNQEVVDPELSAGDAIRFYLNGIAEQEDAFVAAQAFAALADPDRCFQEGDRIAMFLDCSKSTDSTALMGCRISDGFNQTLGVWQRPRGKRGEGFLVDRDLVDARVRECMALYKVVWFGVDPSPAKDDSTEAAYWRPMIDAWHRDFARSLRVWASQGKHGNSVLWDMRYTTPGAADRLRKFCQEVEIIRALVDEDGLDGGFRHDGDPALVAHVNNARARWNKYGLTVGKRTRDSSQLVDLCVAMIAANVGRREALNSGKIRVGSGKRRRRRKVMLA